MNTITILAAMALSYSQTSNAPTYGMGGIRCSNLRAVDFRESAPAG